VTAPVPAGPTDAQAELREEVALWLWERYGSDGFAILDAADLLALPALRAALDAQEAVRRVEALAEELEGYTQRRGRPAPGSYDYGVNLAQADAAECIRRALAGEPLTTPGDNGSGDWMGGPIG
jgi:hypothetical protein